ncbi:MAG: outer membrane protein assembly factor BamB [Burkholderiaceae bacterium]|nr:outer membrane protein assembly factor BamB [Burkholderiaceae bacterium]
MTKGLQWLTPIGALVLAACAGSGPPKPAELEPLTPQIGATLVWSQRISDVRFPLSVAVNSTDADGGVFTVADSDGGVRALQANTGRELWRGNAGAKLAAGVGSDGRFASVVTRDNELVTLETGKVLWRQSLGSRVTSAPLVAGRRVFVMGVDRAVQAFDAYDGLPLWTFKRQGEPLTLSQPGVLTAYKDTLLVGQGPRLTALDPLKGTLRWEVAVASPRGTNEVERLADLVAPAGRFGAVICARAFQAAVACIDAQRGSLLWSKNADGINGVAVDYRFVVGADASGRITAWRIGTGDVAWTYDKLLHRRLSAPRAVGRTIAFGDLEGYVHWLSRDTGLPVLRIETDGSPVVSTPVLSGSTLLVVTQKGGVFAYRPK